VTSTAVLALSGYLLARAAGRPEILTLSVAIVGVRFFGVLRAAASYAERLVVHDLTLTRLVRERVAVFSALAPQVPGPRASTEALETIVADVDKVAELPVRVLVPALATALAAVACVAAAALIRPAAGIALAVVLLLQAALFAARGGARRAGEETDARAALTRELVVSLDAAAELAAWGASEAQAERTEAAGRRVDRLAAAAGRATASAGAISMLAGGAGAVAMLALTAGHVRPVLVAAAALLALGAAEIVGRLADVLDARHEIAAAAARLKGVADRGDAREPGRPPRDAAVTLRGVTLQRDGTAILDGLDLVIAPGERVAVEGPSGIGKSTLADLLAGFLQPGAGDAQVGGVALDQADGEALRRLVRWIPQHPHVFSTTVAGNVRIAAPDADDATIEAALRAVGAGPWIDALPDGLATPLGEHGARCSGGERQRIGLARAYLCGGELLILDEPASHLPRDEALSALRAVLDVDPGRGALLIAHRREELALADRVVSLRGQ
jgi:ATP-binding cassette subfamily C protein CydC